MALRVLELYAGIGGCAAALSSRTHVVAAVDIHLAALEVYRANHPHPVEVRTLDSLRESDFSRWDADFWWMSPPCQPYTRRGRRRDLEDPRAASFLHLLSWIEKLAPAAIALENVPGFENSQAHAALRKVLDGAGYEVLERLLCPTELGIPNRRRRFYLVASRSPLVVREAPRGPQLELRQLIDVEESLARYALDPEIAERYRYAIDIVDPLDPDAVAACFTSAYGRSPVRSGSYLKTPKDLRRFSPGEIASLLGFPQGYRLPPPEAALLAWRLLGNSLSVPAVRWVLTALPEFSGLSA